MSLYWYACISINTYCYVIYHIFSEMDWWVLFNTSLIIWIHLVIHEILANKDFTVTDDLISQLFFVSFVYPTYVSKLKVVDFNNFYFLSYFYFPLFYFWNLGLGLEWQNHAVTQQVTLNNTVTSHRMHGRI